MNKLTNVGAGRVPVSLPVFARRTRAATFRVTYPEARASLMPVARRGLHCGWTKDAGGHLTCNWSETRAADPLDAEAAPEDKPCMHLRGFGLAGFRRERRVARAPYTTGARPNGAWPGCIASPSAATRRGLYANQIFMQSRHVSVRPRLTSERSGAKSVLSVEAQASSAFHNPLKESWAVEALVFRPQPRLRKKCLSTSKPSAVSETV